MIREELGSEALAESSTVPAKRRRRPLPVSRRDAIRERGVTRLGDGLETIPRSVSAMAQGDGYLPVKTHRSHMGWFRWVAPFWRQIRK
jgi:hypothetical protein